MTQMIRLIAATGLLCGYLLASNPCRGDDPLDVGDRVPDFKSQDERGRTWDSRDHIGKKLLVLYFYTGDYTFCSTRQAVRFRDSQKAMEIHGAEVIGISGDSVQAHRLFKDTHQLTQSLLSDDGSLCRQFGVPFRTGGKTVLKDVDGDELLDPLGHPMSLAKKVTAASWTYVVDKDGQIIYREQDVSAMKDCQKVLDFLCTRQQQSPPDLLD